MYFIFAQLHHWDQCGLLAHHNRRNAHPQQKDVLQQPEPSCKQTHGQGREMFRIRAAQCDVSASTSQCGHDVQCQIWQINANISSYNFFVLL